MMAENCTMNLLKERIAALEEEAAHLRAENVRLQKLSAQGPETNRQSAANNDFPALEAILDASIEAINIFDTHGTIVIANEALARRFQCSTAELIGRNISELFPPEVALRRQTLIDQVIASGLPADLEDERSGIILLSHIYPIKNPAGTVTHLAVFSVDITRQRQNEKKLLANRALLIAVQELTHVGGWEWDVATQTVTWTEETYRIHGLSPGKFPEMSPAYIDSSLCCYDPEDRPIILAAFNRCVEQGEAYDLEFPFTAVNGRRLYIRTIGKPIWDGNRIVMVRGNIADITKRRIKEELLKARLRLSEAAATTNLEELLRRLLDETERLTASRISFLHFYEEETKTISLQAWSTATEQLFCKMGNKTQHYRLAEAGVWADCIRARRPIIHNNYDTLPNRKGMPPGHAHITRELMVPVFNNNAIVAILGIGNKDEEYGEKDIDMVSTLAKLAWDIVLWKRADIALNQSLAEKEVLLREVHHRVKNNMAAIIGLFDMQRQSMEDEGARTILAELSSRVRAMSLVHEKLYRSESLTSIDFQEYTESLVSHLRTSFGSPAIQCFIDAREVTIPLDLAVPCGMIINELVTNSLKYAFSKTTATAAREACRILVNLSCRDNRFSLTVADNGVGWPTDFDWRTAKSLGLTLVRMLGEHQLGGSYAVDGSDGIHFTLTFSLRTPGKGRKTHD